jgi:hypothetical protein
VLSSVQGRPARFRANSARTGAPRRRVDALEIGAGNAGHDDLVAEQLPGLARLMKESANKRWLAIRHEG